MTPRNTVGKIVAAFKFYRFEDQSKTLCGVAFQVRSARTINKLTDDSELSTPVLSFSMVVFCLDRSNQKSGHASADRG